jgi:hypothetical protein
MISTPLLQHRSLSVVDRRCEAGPADRPFAQQHEDHSLS